jgi:hypothetical protein
VTLSAPFLQATIESTPLILSGCYGFEVIWAYAQSIATEMVKFVSVRDFTDEMLIHDSMGVVVLSLESNHPIAATMPSASPIPTTVVNKKLTQKRMKKARMTRWHCSLPDGPEDTQ